MNVDEELQLWCSKLAQWAEDKAHIAELWIFGSRARSDNRLDSDLDVAVIMVNGPKETRYGNWVFLSDDWREELEHFLPVAVDLDIGDPDISTNVVGPAVKREGICIFRRNQD